MKKFTLILVIGFASLSMMAQNSTDALRYSRYDYSGSARFVGMGGSFGALGGEASSIIANPAAVGVYRFSEFTVSSGFNVYNSNTDYRGITKNDGHVNFNIPNLSYVGSYKGDANGWKNYSFALNYNRLNSFNSETRLYGNSSNSTLIDDYVNTLNNDNAGVTDVENYSYPFGPSQAWQLLLIDTLTMQDGNGNTVTKYIPYIYLDEFLNTGRTVDNIEQERKIETRGNQSETQFSFGGNYQDKLFLGASLGFQRINYDQEYSFREQYTYSPRLTPSDTLVSAYEESSKLEIRGNGVNLKVGLIYKITEELRAGVSIHSPTFFGLNEVYLFDASSEFSSGEAFRGDSITSNFEYRISTPARYSLSLAYLFQQNAAINVDYEYVDYSSAKFYDKKNFDTDFSNENTQIENTLIGAHNVRIGGEYKFNPFVVRAGYKYEGNPFNSSEVDTDESRNTYSLGAGFRNRNFNFDLAFNYRELSATDNVYASSGAKAVIDENESNLVFTVGWKW